MNARCTPQVRLGLAILALVVVEAAKAAQQARDANVARSRGLVVDLQRTPVEWLRLVVVPGLAVEHGEIVRSGGDPAIQWLKTAFRKPQRFLRERDSLGVRLFLDQLLDPGIQIRPGRLLRVEWHRQGIESHAAIAGTRTIRRMSPRVGDMTTTSVRHGIIVGMAMEPHARFPIPPPVEPMLAKLAEELPTGDGFLFEPKWDGFRAIVFRGGSDVFIQSRDLKPLDRYFPELHETLLTALPDGIVLDGEIVIATPRGLDFDALQLRLHPAACRAHKLAAETPASFVAFDVLAIGGRRCALAAAARAPRVSSNRLLAAVAPPIHLTPMTRDRETAVDWLKRFEGAGLDGVIAKPEDSVYQPGKRAMIKVKHVRTADCVVAGFRWHKSGPDAVGSLLLGIYDDKGTLHHVGVTSAFSMEVRRQLVAELEPLRAGRAEGSPVEGVDERRRAPVTTDARRAEPMERRQGPVVGAAADRARLRGEVRPPAGRSFPARDDLPALAS